MTDGVVRQTPLVRPSERPRLFKCCDWLRSLLAGRQRRRLEPWLLAASEILSAEPPEPAVLPCEIMPHLLLSAKLEAGDLSKLRALGVTHVINAAGAVGRAPTPPSDGMPARRGGIVDYGAAGIKYLELKGEDEEGYPMIKNHFAEALAFVQGVSAAGGRCLVHCVAGINRSGLLAVALLMVSERLDVLTALSRAKRARGRILWNESFQLQLVALAEAEGLLGPRPQVSGKLGPPRAARKSAAEALARF